VCLGCRSCPPMYDWRVFTWNACEFPQLHEYESADTLKTWWLSGNSWHRFALSVRLKAMRIHEAQNHPALLTKPTDDQIWGLTHGGCAVLLGGRVVSPCLGGWGPELLGGSALRGSVGAWGSTLGGSVLGGTIHGLWLHRPAVLGGGRASCEVGSIYQAQSVSCDRSLEFAADSVTILFFQNRRQQITGGGGGGRGTSMAPSERDSFL